MIKTDHPRVGGEHRVTLVESRREAGSSPRRRGTLPYDPSNDQVNRIIPA